MLHVICGSTLWSMLKRCQQSNEVQVEFLVYYDHVYRDVCQPPLKQRVSCSDWVTPTPGHLRVLRTDAAVVGQICAGVEVAKVTRLLIFFIAAVYSP